MLALYRKYRPTSLDTVVAQNSVTTPLKSALKEGKISHSYLFTGPRGCGKTSVARILAHEINNFPYEIEDSYLDIIEIDAASNTGVDNIRELREKALIAPSKGRYKVYIIDEVHMLSKSAFNALLKTLEEPPAHVVFILATTDFDKVPVTITSRSQVFRFRLASPNELLPYLKSIAQKEGIKISDSALKVIIARGGGSFRDSLSLLDQISTLGEKSREISEEDVASALGLPLDSKLSDLLSAYASGDFSAISAQLKSLIQEGLKPEQIAASALEKIISAPTPEFLPLLDTLPSVSAPFPEAKLLLAFLASPNTNISRPAVASAVPSIKAPQTPTPPKTGVTENENDRKCHSQGSKHPQANANQTDFNLENFKRDLSALNPAISKQLEKCQISLDGNVLNIYPTQKITHTILSRSNNSSFLASQLPAEISLVIHELGDLPSDPTLAKISDIMGVSQPYSATDSPF